MNDGNIFHNIAEVMDALFLCVSCFIIVTGFLERIATSGVLGFFSKKVLSYNNSNNNNKSKMMIMMSSDAESVLDPIKKFYSLTAFDLEERAIMVALSIIHSHFSKYRETR